MAPALMLSKRAEIGTRVPRERPISAEPFRVALNSGTCFPYRRVHVCNLTSLSIDRLGVVGVYLLDASLSMRLAREVSFRVSPP